MGDAVIVWRSEEAPAGQTVSGEHASCQNAQRNWTHLLSWVGDFSGLVEGDRMSGAVEFEGAGEGTWSAAQVPEK